MKCAAPGCFGFSLEHFLRRLTRRAPGAGSPCRRDAPCRAATARTTSRLRDRRATSHTSWPSRRSTRCHAPACRRARSRARRSRRGTPSPSAAWPSRDASFRVGAIFSRIFFAASVSCCAHSGWLWLIASPQYAIAKAGSAFCARWKATAAESNSKLCSALTPSRKAACAAGAPEVGKAIEPSSCAVRGVRNASASATEAHEPPPGGFGEARLRILIHEALQALAGDSTAVRAESRSGGRSGRCSPRGGESGGYWPVVRARARSSR